MVIAGYPVRDEGVVWRDIAGEVVIAERDNTTVRVLNGTASAVWILADGTRQVEDIIDEICNRFDVTRVEARTDAEEFYRQLLNAGLVSLQDHSLGI